MTKSVFLALLLVSATAVAAQETRQLDAHEHGTGQFNIAFDGGQIAMELHAPGADIVGFEYVATRAEDRAQVDAAIAALAHPLDLFSLPVAAGCSVVEARAALEGGVKDGHSDHAEHDNKGHDHGDHEDAGAHTEFHAEYLLSCADPSAATVIAFGYFEAFPNALELEVQVISDRGAKAFEVARAVPTLDLRGLF